jgi:hypothetical protein
MGWIVIHLLFARMRYLKNEVETNPCKQGEESTPDEGDITRPRNVGIYGATS